MEVDFLAQRLTQRGWLGRPRVEFYRKTASTVRVLALIRIALGIIILTIYFGLYLGVAKGARSRLYVLGALSLLFAFADWIPYRVCTWQRRPTIITKWATPVSGTASILVNTALVLVIWVTDSGGGWKFAVLLALILAVAGAVIMNTGLYYFVYYEPMRLPPVYEPVCKEAGQDQWDNGAVSADTSGGPLATLYRAQLSSNRGTGDHRRDSRQLEDKLISNSQTANTASFSPTLVFWHVKTSSAAAMIWTLLGMWSAVHIVLQGVRYYKAKGNGKSCDSVCILHLTYPPLWICFIAANCVLVKARVDFRKQLLRRVTPSKALSATFFAILAVWIVDMAFTRPGTPLFERESIYFRWMIINGLVLGVFSILGVVVSSYKL